MEYIGSVLTQVWRLFSVPWPGTGLTCAQVILGIFVVGLSVGILKSILDFVGILSGSVSSGLKSRRDNSYAAYARNRSRNEKYKARYSHAKKNKDKKDK